LVYLYSPVVCSQTLYEPLIADLAALLRIKTSLVTVYYDALPDTELERGFFDGLHMPIVVAYTYNAPQ
jgi:hypothetical protein